jgi:hypothetical protein
VALSAYPFVSFLNRNRTEIVETGLLSFYGLVCVVLALAVLVAVVAWRPKVSADRVAVAVGAFVLSFWSFYLVFSPNPLPQRRLMQLVVWALLTALLVALVYRLSRHAQVRFFAIVLAVILTALPLAEYVVWRLTTESEADTRASASVEPADVVRTPNVYYFVLDEYGRLDQLRDILDYDNTWFYDDLRERDFVVNEAAHSPYQQTVMSMASVLDMDYVATTPDEAPNGNMPFADRLRGENATVDYFKALGYEYIYSSPGVFTWSRCVQGIADLCIEAQNTGVNLSEMELSLLDLTPIGSLDIAREAVTDPAYVMEQLDEHRDEVTEPFFLYGHTLNPHGPFRYTEDCELRDKFAYSELPLNKSELDQANYVQDLACLNQKILTAVDQIRADDPEAIIIVASDHGSKFIPDGYKRLEEWRPEAVREEFGALWAVHLPEECRDGVDEVDNTINTFRIVTACLEGRPPDLADDRAFIWPATGPGPQEVEDLSVLDPVDP